MSFWSIVPVVTGIVGFAGAWYVATQPHRSEIYSRRLDAYQSICAATNLVLTSSIKAGASPNMATAMYEARLTLMEKMGDNALFVTPEVWAASEPICGAQAEPN